jgi:hypothetical protein
VPGDVRILGTGQLLDLQRRLRSAGHENIRSSMQRRIRRAAEPLRDDLQDGIRSLPLVAQPGRTRGGGHSPTSRPLRATIAEAIRISVHTQGATAGARLWIDRSRLPQDITNGLIKQLDDGRVRHPVFNNRSRWVQQNAPAGWWTKTVRQHTPRIEREVARVLDDVRRRIE